MYSPGAYNRVLQVTPSGIRAQSAMEYLMTYGWAILVIAVVLGILFQLGVFGGANLAPKAKSGSCIVQKTSVSTALEGMCQGELPQFVATVSGSGEMKLNNPAGFPIGTQPMSIFAWIETSNTGRQNIFAYGPCNTAQLVFFAVDNGRIEVDFCGDSTNPGPTIDNGAWHFVGFTIAGGTTAVTFYVDGQAYPSSVGTVPNIAGGTYANVINNNAGVNGYQGCCLFYGEIANVQLYNATLSPAEANALYLEGIGGAPVKPQNIVGWWPLNGDVNDYSGNNNNGQNLGVGYSSSWASAYTAP